MSNRLFSVGIAFLIGAPDNIGKVFYTSFLPDFPTTNASQRQQQIMLATASATPFDVTIVGKGGSYLGETITIDNTRVTTVPMPVWPAWQGIKLYADFDFIAYSTTWGDSSADATLLFPVDVLGTDYLVMGLSYYSSAKPTYRPYIYVIGTADGTTVTVTLPNNSVVPFSLNEMDVYTIPFTGESSGTRIVSSSPVAVITGHDCLYFPEGCDGCDLVYEQVIVQKTSSIPIYRDASFRCHRQTHLACNSL